MSNIYIQEPPALGKVLLKTTVGDIDVELWTKEAPKACRNFIQLCMEGYYKGTIFHRVVPGFIVQGGDPNGDGTGGESIYGAPFKDEFHSRLRFNRRGLVAMANAGKDDNGSQFFFTLAATPELQNKHTIFGKVTGDTIYNMLKLAEGNIGPDERPEHPYKITNTEVLINPYNDIVPRVKIRKEEVEQRPKKKKERQGVKNFGLLSFGEEAEEDEGEAVEYRGKPKSTHDLLKDPKLSNKTAAELELEEKDEQESQNIKEKNIKRQETEATVSSIRDKLKSKREKSPNVMEKEKKAEDDDSDSSGEYYLGKERDIERKKQTDRIKDEIKQLKKEMRGSKQEKNLKEEDDSKEKNKIKDQEDNEMYQKFVEEQEKYKKLKENLPKKGAARSRHTNSNRKAKTKKPWVKNLYENKDYPDNYTDKKFLEQLKKNLYVEKVTLSQAVLGSFRVVNRLCLSVLYAVLFVYMYNDWISTKTVISISTCLSIFGYFIYLFYEDIDSFTGHLKTVLVYLVIGYLLSPILYTLTDTVSTDTIFALSVIMMCVHLLFFDYGVAAAVVSNSLSINAALFGSICLISRLSNPFDAFVLLTVSVKVFVLSPRLFRSITNSSLFLAILFIIFLLTVVCLYTTSTILLLYFLLSVFLISFHCPYLFVKWQKYKDNIHGPWDEAVINDSDDVDDYLNS